MITDVEARRIASDWHGGGGSALYVLTSTGAIVLNDQGMEWLNVKEEIQACLDSTYSDQSRLEWLLKYVEKHGSRGLVVGWGQLSW